MASKKVVVPALNHGDYQEADGKQKTVFSRSVDIDGKPLTIRAVLTTTPKNGTYDVVIKLTTEVFQAEEKTTNQVVGLAAALMLKGGAKGQAWKNGWEDRNSDDNQMSMGFGEEEEQPSSSAA